MTDRRSDWLSTGLALGGGVILVVLGVIVFRTPAATGFEFSVYRGYPLYFWGLAILGLVLGQALIVRQAFSETETTPSWRLGLFVIIGIQTLMFLMPYLRGYVSYDRADVLTHVGFIRNIQEFGVVMPTDIYPNIHLLTLGLSYATGVEPLSIVNSVSVIIPVFSLVAWYALVTQLYDRRPALLTLPFAAVLIGGSAYTNPSPYAMSTQLVPFVLYLFVRMLRTRTMASKIALALVVISVVIYHPLTTAFVVIGLGCYGLVSLVRRHELLPSSDPVEEFSFTSTKVTAQLAVGLFAGWYFQFTPILNKSGEALRALLGQQPGESQLAKYSSTVAEISPRLIDLIILTLADYGITGVFLLLGGLFTVSLVGKFLRGEGGDASTFEVAFTAAFLVYTGLSVFFFVFDLVVGWGRVLTFVRFFGVLVVGLLFHRLYQQFNGTGTRSLVTGVLAVCLVSMALFGTADLYHSPMKAEANHQVTEADLDGSKWFLENRNRYNRYTEHGVHLFRFADVIYGVNKTTKRQVVKENPPPPPDRFGYTNNSSLAASYDEDTYLLITERGREFHREVHPGYRDSWSFYPRDYDRLGKDNGVVRLYDNGEYDIYLVSKET